MGRNAREVGSARKKTAIVVLCLLLVAAAAWNMELGREVAILHHLADGEEFEIPLRALIDHGKALFEAVWTPQEGGGRPLVKGTGAPLADPTSPVELQTIANSRNTIGMFGSGFIEMLSRQMTAALQAIRDGIPPGGSVELVTKGISYGVLNRDGSGNWETSGVTSLPAPSLASTGPDDPPNLALRPFHQASGVISLRQFSNSAQRCVRLQSFRFLRRPSIDRRKS